MFQKKQIDFKNNFLTVWGDGAVGKMLTVWRYGPKFNLPEPI